jgi:hypothetical protein
LWVATFRTGLNRHDPKAAAFQHDKIDRRHGDVGDLRSHRPSDRNA